jgi:hypothetical protein
MTATAAGRSTTTLTPPQQAVPVRRTWKPGADDLADAGVLLVLSALALVGLGSVYEGSAAMLVGLFGALVGVVAAWICAARRLGAISSLLVMLAAFVIGSGPAVSDAALAFVLPGPGIPAGLLDGLVHSWSDLITTAPPVGVGGGLGVVPYVLGFGAAGVGMLLARRTQQTVLPAAPALVSLGAGLVLGTIEPVNVLIQGAGFALVALAWGATRSNRDRRSADGSIYWPRVASGAGMLAGVLLIGALVGPALPFAEAEDRYVAREYAVPPFDPQDYPSPLAGYRAYRTKEAKEATFFTVDGLPKGGLVRLATMDTYNGVVWVVSSSSAAGSGRFERVGQRILPVPEGTSAKIGVTVDEYTGVWVPSVGATRSVEFAGPAADDLANAFRYNRTTGTGATPVPLRADDSFTLDVTVPPAAKPAELKSAAVDRSANVPVSDDLPEDAEALQSIRDLAFSKAGKGGAPYTQAEKLAEFLRTAGAFSDGGPEAQGASDVPAGHSIARLSQFLTAAEPVGNAEQFAAAMAVMARELGLPARVVMGFKPEKSGNVALRGADADAWVEIAFEGYGWVPFDPVPDEDKKPKQQEQQRPLEEELAQQESPPPTYLDPPDAAPELANQKAKKRADDGAGGGFELPGFVVLALKYIVFPLAIVAAIAIAIAFVKRARMRRRRNQGSAVDRVQGAWLEISDRLRDLGHRPRPGITRREFAADVASDRWPKGLLFANQVDHVMFGPEDPDVAVAEAVWAQADREFDALVQPLTRKQRIKAAVSLASLRPRRR